MATIDMASNILSLTSVYPRLLNATTAGDFVDTHGFESVTLELSAGTYTDGQQLWTLQDSDTVTAGDFVDVDPNLLIYDNFFPGNIVDNSLQRFTYFLGYVGRKRYVRAHLLAVAGVTGAVYGANIILGTPHTPPTILVPPNQVG